MKITSGWDEHLTEKKLAVNSTARVRKSRKRLFVISKNGEIYVISEKNRWNNEKTT